MAGLINTVRLDGRRDVAVVLTDRGWDLLESHRGRDQDLRQEFYAGLTRERELEHDSQVCQAYLSIADRLEERDARLERVVLDYELVRSKASPSGRRRPGLQPCLELPRIRV